MCYDDQANAQQTAEMYRGMEGVLAVDCYEIHGVWHVYVTYDDQHGGGTVKVY